MKRRVLAVGDGYRAKLDDLGGTGPLFLRAGALSSTGFDWSDLESFRIELAATLVSKLGYPGDVVVTTKGNSIGRVGLVPKNAPSFVYSPHLSYWRSLDPSVLTPRYLYYWSRSRSFEQQLRSLAFGTDMAPYFSLRDQSRLRVTLPGVSEQLAIAEVLGALDDKIAANLTLDATLIELLDAMQGEFDSTEIQLGEVADFHNRRRVPLSSRERELRAGPVPYYGAAGKIDSIDDAIFDQCLLLVGEDGSVVNDAGGPVSQYIWGRSWVNNHAHVLTGRGISTEALAVIIKSSDVKPLVTGAVQPKLSMSNLRKLVLRLPSHPAERAVFDSRCQSFFALRRSVAEESRTLAELRDTLLPALMSGKLRVKDVEQQIGEVSR